MKNELLQRIKNNDASLTEINLSNLQISDDEAVALAKALHMNSHIQKINLADNQIGNEGASAIANLLKANTRLLEINYNNNQIDDDLLLKTIDLLLKRNQCLKKYPGYTKLIKSEFAKEGMYKTSFHPTGTTSQPLTGVFGSSRQRSSVISLEREKDKKK